MFERRYENNYDIYTDEEYLLWLQQYHLESMPLIEEIPPNQVTFKNIILEHVGLQE